MAWIFLILAGCFEIGFTACLNIAQNNQGKAAMMAWAGFGICITLSMALLSKAIESIPIGTAYAVWTGIGAAGTAIFGMIFFKEPVEFWRIFFICTLILSVIGLKFVSH